MIQVKIYQHNLSLDRKKLDEVFHNYLLYYFCSLPNVIGVGFDYSNDNLKTIAEKAYILGLKPILLTGPKFLKLIETALLFDRKIVDIRFTVDIDPEDEEELRNLLITGTSGSYLISLLKRIIDSDNTFIKNISWYEGNEQPVKLSLYDNGILYVNDGLESLANSDPILSSAVTYQEITTL